MEWRIKEKSNLRDDEFINFIKIYPCLFDKSQTPEMKSKKNYALLAIMENIKSNIGVNINASQIRKKIENMKSRIRHKCDKQKTEDLKIKLKPYEEKLLELMNFKNNPVASNIPGEDQAGIKSCSKDGLKTEVFADCQEPEESNTSEESIEVVHFPAPLRKKFQNEYCSLLPLKRKLLEQQKVLNEQKKEILKLQKEKLLLEISILKRKQKKVTSEQDYAGGFEHIEI